MHNYDKKHKLVLPVCAVQSQGSIPRSYTYKTSKIIYKNKCFEQFFCPAIFFILWQYLKYGGKVVVLCTRNSRKRIFSSSLPALFSGFPNWRFSFPTMITSLVRNLGTPKGVIVCWWLQTCDIYFCFERVCFSSFYLSSSFQFLSINIWWLLVESRRSSTVCYFFEICMK